MRLLRFALLGVASFPLFYYLIALYSIRRFFRHPGPEVAAPDFTPPVSNLKPIRGLDPDAYENFASLCRQDYPEFELLFCVGGEDDPAVPILEKLVRDFPQCRIRIFFGSGRSGSNDKVSKLARLAAEARHEVLVINDSDVWVEPDYLRRIVAPLQDPRVGAVTCLYKSIQDHTLTEHLQSIGMISDFFPSIIVARELDGVHFALGTTIATRRANLREFGGYEALENRPADDLLVGRLIAEQGHEVRLLPYAVLTVSDYRSLRELLHKRLRWIVVMRHMRPWGHLGLIFTHGLAWSLIAIAIRPTLPVALVFGGGYLVLRVAMTWMVGAGGLHKQGLWKRLPLILVWDAVAFCLWLVSFTRTSIRWRDGFYYIRDGRLVPVAPASRP